MSPLPVPKGADRVLLIGGTFDPPHRAHVDLPAAARRALWGPLGWMLYVPAAQSPHKQTPPAASGPDRCRMLHLALGAAERAAVWTDELDRGGPSYTVDTVARARAALGSACDLRLLIGSDQAAQFHRWREPRRIIDLAEPAVMPRTPLDTPQAMDASLRDTGFWTEAERTDWARRFLPLPVTPVSATDVRALVRAGDQDAELQQLLGAPVIQYIRARGLYA